MIPVSDAFKQAYDSNSRLWKLKVEVQRNDIGAPWVDISDRVESCTISFDYERRNGTANVNFDNYDQTLSPLNRESPTNFIGGVYNPLFDAMHKIRISEGLLTANGWEYVTKFTGVIGDDINVDSYPNQVSVSCRDFSKYLQDTYIFQSRTYKLLVVENVIQDMINQFTPDLGIKVVLGNPTKFMIGRPDNPYTAKDTNLWDAVQSLADAASHDLMFLEDGTLMLKKSVKKFDDQTPVAIFDESQLVKDQLSLSDADVRNHIVLKVTGLNPIEKKNAKSIEKYGRRYMEVHRAMANIITTAEQGNQLVNDMLYDMSFVAPQEEVEVPLYPHIQVGDIVAIDNTQTGVDSTYEIFKIVKVQDTFSATNKRTSLTLKGHTDYTPEDSTPPLPPTNLRASLITRTVKNYNMSGWYGIQKVTSYPYLQWSAPTSNVSGTAIPVDFGGYSIYRKDDLYHNMIATGNIMWSQVSGSSAHTWTPPLNPADEYSLYGEYMLTRTGYLLTVKMIDSLKPNDNWSVVVTTTYSGGAYHPTVQAVRSGNTVKNSGALSMTTGNALPIRIDLASGNVSIYTGNTLTLFHSMPMPSGGLTFGAIGGFQQQNYAYVQNVSYKQNDWYPVSALASYIPSLGLKVEGFYDYTAATDPQNYQYKVIAVDRLGAPSSSSAITGISVPPVYYYGSGGRISTNPVEYR